jgi:osmotically-inducible protein OsmY
MTRCARPDRAEPLAALCVLAAFAVSLAGAAHAQVGTEPDPFEQVTTDIANCPVPAPPSYADTATDAFQARFEAHWRGERGTSCYNSGRCRLPNSFLYDKEIIPRVKKFILQDQRSAGTSLWIAGQRRWVTLQGCVRSKEQAKALVEAVQTVDDVERVVDETMVGTQGKPPYRVPR